MNNEKLKVKFDSKILYVEDNIAYLQLSLNGEVVEQLLTIDLGKFKEELEMLN